MAEEKLTNKFKVNDRVKRIKGVGCHGIVKELKTEVTAARADSKDKPVMITVQWDNGTFSYFTPESLELV